MNQLYVVGIGPGDDKRITAEAKHTLAGSDLIVGYTVYTELVEKQFPEKTYLATGMRQETERCKKALEAFLKSNPGEEGIDRIWKLLILYPWFSPSSCGQTFTHICFQPDYARLPSMPERLRISGSPDVTKIVFS